MEKLLCEKIVRIIRNKKRLEKELNVILTNRGKEVTIRGSPQDEFSASRVLEALNFGFPYAEALSIKRDGAMFEKLNIKHHSRSKDLKRIRARIIGKAGKALKTLNSLSHCSFELKGNEVGIIGLPELIEGAQNALISLIKGSKHSNVYHNLEKSKVADPLDLGLK